MFCNYYYYYYFISSIQGIYNYTSKSNKVSRVYTAAVIL